LFVIHGSLKYCGYRTRLSRTAVVWLYPAVHEEMARADHLFQAGARKLAEAHERR